MSDFELLVYNAEQLDAIEPWCYRVVRNGTKKPKWKEPPKVCKLYK